MNLASQYHIIADGAGWIDARARGRLKFEGKDAAPFLHALVTNDVESLAVGNGVYATFLTPQGRMLTDLTIHRLEDRLLVAVPAGLSTSLADRFDQLIFSEDVRVSDESASTAEMGVVGGSASVALAQAFDLQPSDLQTLPPLGHVIAGDAVIARSTAFELPAFDVFIPGGGFDAIVRRLVDHGVVAIAPELADAMRIDAGRPAFGLDMTEETIPLEAGLLDRAISTTKGCYVGQEVIVRILHRGGGRVVRRLVKLDSDATPADLPPPDALIFDGGREIGRITSASPSPRAPRVIALGYVHRDATEIGRSIEFDSPRGRQKGTIVGLAG
jgi:folate-binding protein YgfZ